MAVTAALFIGSEIYRGSSYGGGHPLRVPRVSTVMDLARALGWLEGCYRTSPCAKPAALLAFHTAEYIAALKAAEAGEIAAAAMARHHLGTLSNPVFPQIYRRPATGAGGVLLASELLAAGGAVHVPGGGTHHGLPDRANGFCYLNDPVLAIMALRRMGLRVAYVDLDAHHCDGVEFAFAGVPEVLLISVHEEARWPFTGALGVAGGNCVNLPVPAQYNDSEARLVLQEMILPRLQAFGPQVIVLQAGADALREDPLSRLALSNNSYVEALRAIRPMAPRLMLLGGGGYNPWSVARCWTLLWAELSGRAVPDLLPEAAQSVLRALSWGGGGRALPAPALLTTLRDAPREGGIRDELRARMAVLARA
ncbi:acetoin utilization protein AcuC [Cypionkella sp.]|uniref:acetoin utilization protein AcuC n=1 Tax=Cypionkella sp. TaxID=2811411 RepID=UPI0027175AC7|nr:acetoin utilization protein AcuC [Cypionkella sp.]MDO8984781.1 acetoin utilization protein AcuC [Cypionkella sp.]MDP1575908.1 acetoin utilization protein AcuC [Cypionkella sp.]MDP2050865.1 acetoin utilization protein AcuC [Cypionkella sp.]